MQHVIFIFRNLKLLTCPNRIISFAGNGFRKNSVKHIVLVFMINIQPDIRAFQGDVGCLRDVEPASLDGLLSFNVLAYLTHEEEQVFYEEAQRVVRPGGYLVVTHSNELFDLFSLNRYTVEFMRRHLVADPERSARLPELLTAADRPDNPTAYNGHC